MPTSSKRSSSRGSAHRSDATITRPHAGRRDTRDLESSASSSDNDPNVRALGSSAGRSRQRKADVISEDSNSLSESSGQSDDDKVAHRNFERDLEKGARKPRETIMRSLPPGSVRGDAGGMPTKPKSSRKQAKRNAYTQVAGADNSDGDDGYYATPSGAGGGYPAPGQVPQKNSFMTKTRWIILGIVVALVLALIAGVSIWLYKKKDEDLTDTSTTNSTELMNNSTTSPLTSHASKTSATTLHTLDSIDDSSSTASATSASGKSENTALSPNTASSTTAARGHSLDSANSSMKENDTVSIQTVPNPTGPAPTGLSTATAASQSDSEKNPFSVPESLNAGHGPVQTTALQAQDKDAKTGWKEPSAPPMETATAPQRTDQASANQSRPSITFLGGVPQPEPTVSPDQGNGTPKYDGQVSWFSASQHVSTCNSVFSDNDMVAALQPELYGTSGDVSPFCGATIKVWNPSTDKTITVSIQDECPLCSGELALDLSRTAFERLGDLDDGILQVQWWWTDPALAAKMPQTLHAQPGPQIEPTTGTVADKGSAGSGQGQGDADSFSDGSWDGVTTVKNDSWGVAADQSRAAETGAPMAAATESAPAPAQAKDIADGELDDEQQWK